MTRPSDLCGVCGQPSQDRYAHDRLAVTVCAECFRDDLPAVSRLLAWADGETLTPIKQLLNELRAVDRFDDARIMLDGLINRTVI